MKNKPYAKAIVEIDDTNIESWSKTIVILMAILGISMIAIPLINSWVN